MQIKNKKQNMLFQYTFFGLKVYKGLYIRVKGLKKWVNTQLRFSDYEKFVCNTINATITKEQISFGSIKLVIYTKVNNKNILCKFNREILDEDRIATYPLRSTAALQIKGGQRSITANLWALTAHIYHVMIIMTGGFSKKSFLSLYPRNSFEQS